LTPLGCGIVGCGGAAADMCRAIQQLPETYVAAVFDRVEERAADFASRYRDAVHHRSLDELLEDTAVDVVYVALPHWLLASTSERALESGKHVLVEKPMALSVEAVRSLERLAVERERTIAPVFELRMSAVAREARRLVVAGAIGPVKAVRIQTLIDKPDAYWRSGPRGLVPDNWRSRRAEAGGGVVLMNSIHQLDLARYVAGVTFVRAAAEAVTLYADVEVEDYAAAVLGLSNGGVGSLVAAAHSPGATGEERLEVDGSAGQLKLPDPTGPDVSHLRVFLRRPWEDLAADRWLDLDLGETDTYAELLRGFVRAIEEGTTPPATTEDAAAALATVLAIYESSETGRTAEVGVPLG
jgi:UDP-N-acetyl-2-amino-2-deoxyglucuronate dehydrogenase